MPRPLWRVWHTTLGKKIPCFSSCWSREALAKDIQKMDELDLKSLSLGELKAKIIEGIEACVHGYRSGRQWHVGRHAARELLKCVTIHLTDGGMAGAQRAMHEMQEASDLTEASYYMPNLHAPSAARKRGQRCRARSRRTPVLCDDAARRHSVGLVVSPGGVNPH